MGGTRLGFVRKPTPNCELHKKMRSTSSSHLALLLAAATLQQAAALIAPAPYARPMRTWATGSALLAAASLHTTTALLPAARACPPQLRRRARPAVACDFETIEDEDEYANALERYRSWGVLDGSVGAGASGGRQPIGAGVEPKAAAEAALAPLLDAVDGFDGSLAVVEVVDDIVTLAYTGPPHFRAAIELALRDKMPRVERVVFVE